MDLSCVTASLDQREVSFLLLPPGFVGLRLLADKARYERELSLLLKSESVARCV